jgi:hypothetical protein
MLNLVVVKLPLALKRLRGRQLERALSFDGKTRNEYLNFVGKCLKKRLPVRLRKVQNDNIKMELLYTDRKVSIYMELTHNRMKWRAMILLVLLTVLLITCYRQQLSLTNSSSCCQLYVSSLIAIISYVGIHHPQFLGTFAKLRKATISFVIYVRPSAWNNSASTGWIFMKFGN